MRKTTGQIIREQQKARALTRGKEQQKRDNQILEMLLLQIPVTQICMELNIGLSTMRHTKTRLRNAGLL
jgi:hypothetical protein